MRPASVERSNHTGRIERTPVRSLKCRSTPGVCRGFFWPLDLRRICVLEPDGLAAVYDRVTVILSVFTLGEQNRLRLRTVVPRSSQAAYRRIAKAEALNALSNASGQPDGGPVDTAAKEPKNRQVSRHLNLGLLSRSKLAAFGESDGFEP